MTRLSCKYPKAVHVSTHERDSHIVRGHFRGTAWVPAHIRNGSTVREHCRS